MAKKRRKMAKTCREGHAKASSRKNVGQKKASIEERQSESSKRSGSVERTERASRGTSAEPRRGPATRRRRQPERAQRALNCVPARPGRRPCGTRGCSTTTWKQSAPLDDVELPSLENDRARAMGNSSSDVPWPVPLPLHRTPVLSAHRPPQHGQAIRVATRCRAQAETSP